MNLPHDDMVTILQEREKGWMELRAFDSIQASLQATPVPLPAPTPEPAQAQTVYDFLDDVPQQFKTQEKCLLLPLRRVPGVREHGAGLSTVASRQPHCSTSDSTTTTCDSTTTTSSDSKLDYPTILTHVS